MLSRDDVLRAQDLVTEMVDVPEWGGQLCVKTLTGLEADIYDQACIEGRGKNAKINLRNARARLVAWAVVDPETKQRIFSDADIGRLGSKSAKALDRLFNVAQKLSGMGVGDFEELAKNSESDQNDDSNSD